MTLLVTNRRRRSRRRFSRRSVSSHSSEEPTLDPLQVAGADIERMPNSGDAVSFDLSINGLQSYAMSSVGINQHPVAPAYAANSSPALENNDLVTPACLPHRQRLPAIVWPQHAIKTYQSIVQSEASFNSCSSISSNRSRQAPVTTNAPHLSHAAVTNTPFHQEHNDNSMHYIVASHSSPSSDQGNQAAVPRYAGEPVNPFHCCYGMPPTQH
jgi:hypothetical protein